MTSLQRQISRFYTRAVFTVSNLINSNIEGNISVLQWSFKIYQLLRFEGIIGK